MLWRYFIILVSLGILGVLSVRIDPPDSYKESDFQLAEVSHRDFDILVNTVGVLDAARSYMLSSAIRGDKGKIITLIDDGARVNVGDTLVKLDPSPFEEEIHRLKGEVSSLESAVNAARQILEWEKSQVEREIRTAEFNVKIAKLEMRKLVEADGPLQMTQHKEETEKAREEYERYLSYLFDLEELKHEGYSNPTEIRLARKKSLELKEKYGAANKKYTNYTDYMFPALKETTDVRLEKAQAELEQIRKGSAFKIAKAVSALEEMKTRLETANTSLRQARDELDKTTIHAPFAGIAILYEAFRDGQKRKPRVGDRVLRNQPLLYLPDISSMIVRTRIREIDLYKIAVGQMCSVKADAYPDMLLKGEVTFIGSLASGRFGSVTAEKYFRVTISVKGENSRLRPGMTARISIMTDRVQNALSVPIQSVFNESGGTYCYRLTGEGFRKANISPGRQNEDIVEITAGLREGDQVSLVRPVMVSSQ